MAEVAFKLFPSKALVPPAIRSPSQINLVYNAPSSAIPRKLSTVSCFKPRSPRPIRTTITAATGSQTSYPRRTPARDRVIDFGKYRGRMLGSLPSNYLKWMSKNLRAGDTIEWANLADELLDDPVYRDRIEWEFAEKILTGDVASAGSSGGGTAAELLEISKKFGWDNEDKRAWSKIDFALLGTSKGGRIPRLAAKKETDGGVSVKSLKKKEKIEVEEGENEERRRVRREKAQLRRRRHGGVNISSKVVEREGDGGADGEAPDTVVVRRSPFPGRESLLRKALNRQRF